MSLSVKFLVPLNLLIVLIWVAHFLITRATLEEAMLAGEAEAMGQLASSLKAQLEATVVRGDDVESVAEQIDALAGRWPELDLMVIDDTFRVRVASDPSRVGRRWHEDGIEAVLASTASSTWNLADHAHDGRRAIDFSIGVVDGDGQVRYVVHIAKWLDRMHGALASLRRHNLTSAVGELVGVAVAINLLTIFLVLRPLRDIRRRIAESGWLDERPRLERRDEIQHLNAVVSSMLDRVQTRTESLRSTLGKKESALQRVAADRDHLAHSVNQVRGELALAEERLVRAERIAALSQLSSALAHELRNPLHIIRATAEIAASTSPEVAELATDIMDEVDRVNRLITELLDYTRPSDLHWQSIDLRALLEGVRQRTCRGTCEDDFANCGLCTIAVDDDAAAIEGDPVLLTQAMVNLFANARSVSPEGATIEIAAARKGKDEVVLTVADRGPGIADEDRAHIFEPFFTRHPSGTGLGLPTVQKIADLHHGSIEIMHRDGGGTVARLRLPIAKSGEST